MNLVRKYKISKLLNQPLTVVESEIIDFIHEWLKDLILFKYDKYPYSVFYMSPTGLCVLEKSIEYQYLLIRYKSFWEILYYKYELDEKNIQAILKFFIEQEIKEQVSPPLTSIDGTAGKMVEKMVEDAFKQQYNIR